jgi:hypothetical protein
MKYILYYSNYCEHSKRLLLTLAKQKIEVNDISYICIDRRKVVEAGICAVLDNGKEIPIPENIKEVPSLVMLNHGNAILVGDDIFNHFKKPAKQEMLEDPAAFSFTEMTGSSDQYSYLDMTPDDLSAKGNGGLRMLHDYATLNNVDRIETPPDEEDIKTTVTMEDIQKKRGEEINLNR